MASVKAGITFHSSTEPGAEMLKPHCFITSSPHSQHFRCYLPLNFIDLNWMIGSPLAGAHSGAKIEKLDESNYEQPFGLHTAGQCYVILRLGICILYDKSS